MSFLLAFLLLVALGNAKMDVSFYGESQCPYCRQFLMIWNDLYFEFKPYVDFHFVPWGNAYFATEMCGDGPYNPQQRDCWYEHCIVQSNDDEDACFGGNTVYQHSTKEGIVDIYETCVMDLMGMDEAVSFSFCCEGSKMDDDSMTARELMESCLDDPSVHDVIHDCYTTDGHVLEVMNAKQTPKHPGVPYVLVDGKPMDNPMIIKDVLCDALKENGDYPIICGSGRSESAPLIGAIKSAYS